MTIHEMLAALDIAEDRELIQEFWNLANNRQKVNVNLLSDDDVSILQVSGRSVVALRIPRATRWQRPVFLGPTPFGGTI